MLHHSDQGSQYTSEQFQRLMADHCITCSRSRSGNVYDNAAMESFFSSLKTERTARRVQFNPRASWGRHLGLEVVAAGSRKDDQLLLAQLSFRGRLYGQMRAAGAEAWHGIHVSVTSQWPL
jgi:transposase InsO family protein